MKKLFLSFIAICVASMCSLTAWATERVAPTFPEAQTLESGNTYYLYNVDSKLFLHRQSTSGVNLSAEGSPVKFISREDKAAGAYTIQFADDYYLHLWYSDKDAANYEDNNSYQVVSGSSSAYRIQKSTNASGYNASHYFGHDINDSDASSLRSDLTSGNIIWQLFDEDDAEAVLRYGAKRALYDALESAEVNYAWAIADFEAIYENEASTNAELNAAAAALNKLLSMSTGYQAPWWNERPILFSTSDGNFGQSPWDTWALPDNSYTRGTRFERVIHKGESSSISSTVFVEEPSTLVYSTGGGEGDLTVSVDGTKVRNLNNVQIRTAPSDKTHTRFFEELEPGLHTITWTYIDQSSSWNYYYLYDVGVLSKPQITVNLLEQGSLGTEVLYNTDHVKNVRRLKVKGAMNADDWAKIKMMSTLLELDLSEAQFTEIPANQFLVSYSDTTMNFLHKVVLPEGLTTIGDKAFHYSFVEDVNLPSTMKRIGKEAFYCSHVKELIMPDDMTDFYGGDDYGYCFSNMYWLNKLVLPKNLTRIPRETFYQGYYITEAVMPEKLQTVGEYAFNSCHRMQTILPEGLKTIEESGFYDCPTLNSPLPSTLTTIGRYAFQHARGYKSLVIPQSVTSIGEYAFANCTNMTKVELSVNQYWLANGVFQNCSKLDTVKLKSPTVTTISSYYPLTDITKVVLQVPHYLVNDYKLHSYWYNAKAIEPFDYSEITFIPIHGNLTLNHERFGGQPSIDVWGNAYLKINGDAAQQLADLHVRTENNGSNHYYGQILNNCNQITANGRNGVHYRTDAKKWYFVSLPFDLDVSQIKTWEAGVQNAIRYYDGMGRAVNGKSGNWKNVDRTSIIPAGTGFIYQTNIAAWTTFYAADTENKYGTLRNTEFVKSLAVNASETTSNKGWNLVGNPYQCYYNNHCLNFTAPITVWNGSTYVAYSLTDDDYAIRPNEAFFVQCPNEEYTTIGFPLQGRQLTSVIESQNAVKEWAPQAKTRQVVNITVAGGETEDMTRVVLNEEASMAYETSCDASKFMSMDSSVPQIYTLDAEGTQYAINERPFAEGFVSLGFYAGTEGSYTISSSRCDAEKVFITDNLTGTTTDITDGAYCFTAKAGTDNTRFTLSFVASDATAIKEIDKDAIVGKVDVYSVEGKFLGNDASRLGAGIYIVRQGKNTSKVIVR